MNTRKASQELNDSFDKLSKTALGVKAERDELLNALSSLMEVIDGVDDDREIPDEILENCRKAIAKARGAA